MGTVGCGNLTAGGFAEVTVAVSGDLGGSSLGAPMGAGSSPSAPTPALAEQPARSSHEVQGEIELEFTLHLVSDDGIVLQLGDGDLEIEVDLRGETEIDAIDRQMVPANRYTQLRIVFTEVHVEAQGLVIDGVPVPALDVEIEDASVLATREVELRLDEGGFARLVVDMNALAWIQAVDPITQTVDESVFASLIDVVIE